MRLQESLLVLVAPFDSLAPTSKRDERDREESLSARASF